MQYKRQVRMPQTGFTLIEILAGILMATAFVLITTQAIAISAVFRVRAQREAEAVNAIQADLEDIKFRSVKNLTGQCGDNATLTTGFGQALINDVPVLPNNDNDGNANTTNITLLNKSYRMTRTLAVENAAPYSLLTVSYAVSDLDTNNIIADLYTEVIPDAAFDCD